MASAVSAALLLLAGGARAQESQNTDEGAPAA